MSAGNPYKRVTTGQRLTIPAQAWNAVLDEIESKNASGFRAGAVGNHPISFVLCKNNSGANVAQFGVMGIQGVVLTPTQNMEDFKSRVLLNGSASTFSLYAGKFVIAAEPITNGEIGRAYAAGVIPAKISVTNTAHTFADVKDGDPTQLASATTGAAKILWAESGTGTKWAVVSLNSGNGASSTSTASTFLVYLTKTTGTDGDGVTAAAWVYSVYSDAAKTILLATGKAPVARRALRFINGPATEGLWDGTNLVYAFEDYPPDTCAETFTGSTS